MKYFCIAGQYLDPLCHSSSTCCKAAVSRRPRTPRGQWPCSQPCLVLRPGQKRAQRRRLRQQGALHGPRGQDRLTGAVQRVRVVPGAVPGSSDAPGSLCQSSGPVRNAARATPLAVSSENTMVLKLRAWLHLDLDLRVWSQKLSVPPSS